MAQPPKNLELVKSFGQKKDGEAGTNMFPKIDKDYQWFRYCICFHLANTMNVFFKRQVQSTVMISPKSWSWSLSTSETTFNIPSTSKPTIQPSEGIVRPPIHQQTRRDLIGQGGRAEMAGQGVQRLEGFGWITSFWSPGFFQKIQCS